MASARTARIGGISTSQNNQPVEGSGRVLRLYERVASDVRAALASGRYKIGDRLPSERDLAQQYKVSRPTIREAIIDDCALAGVMKKRGAIRLLLTDRAESVRPYPRIGDIGAMISRSAYAQLGYSPLALVGTLAGLALVFLAPPWLVLTKTGLAQVAAYFAWALMTLSFQPMLRFYRRSPAWGVLLPLIALVYCWYTLVSAVQVWTGTGGRWKGRVQAQVGA